MIVSGYTSINALVARVHVDEGNIAKLAVGRQGRGPGGCRVVRLKGVRMRVLLVEDDDGVASARHGIRLLPLASVLPAFQSAYGPVYQPDSVPANAYGSTAEIPTIGIANLLICRPDADPEITAVVARVLVTHAARLVPEQALGIQFLDPRSLIATAGIPLHSGAITAYRSLHG